MAVSKICNKDNFSMTPPGPWKKVFKTIEIKPTLLSETTTSPQNIQK